MIAEWIKKNTVSLENKTVAISGATGGLGRELCFHLASLGAELVLLDRNMTKSRALAKELRERFAGVVVSHVKIDMENMAEVREAVDSLLRMPIDHLILNAGAYSIPRHKCESGYDNVFQINFVSPYYLARALLPHLEKRGGKVVAVGSIAHRYSKTDPEDIDFSTRKKASLVYGNAKRYLMLALGSLDNVVIAHPGITFTGITAHYPKPVFAIIKHPMKLIFMKPRKASLSILRALFEDRHGYEWIGPGIFDVWGYPKKKPLRFCEEEAKRVRDKAREICDKL